MRILYKFASRERPYKFFAAIENIIAMSRHDDYEILCTFDIDDPTMTTNAVRDKLATYEKVKPYWGFSGSKIGAINRDMDFAQPWDILICMADDMVWGYEGFDVQIIALFDALFPDLDGLLHLPDGHVNERIPTMHIVGKKYYDRFGYIYFPGYNAVYCDNEAMDVAKILGKHRYVQLSLFSHNHPIWGKAEFDALYMKNEEPIKYAKDGELYRQRKEINFGL